MLPRWHGLKPRPAYRDSREYGQAWVRIGISLAVLLYLVWIAGLPADGSGVSAIVQWLVMAELLAGVLLLLWIMARPARSHVRRAIGMLCDYGLMTACMILVGEPLAWGYVLMMWVTIGNGLRFGNRYLYAAMAMAVAGFALVVACNGYWQQNRNLGYGLVLGLAAVPLYLSTLTRRLARAVEHALQASEAKSQFLANMSHEFRTPLGSLAGMSELLAATPLDAEQRECVDSIQASTRSLLSLVEDVLDLAAIEAGKRRLEPIVFSPREVVENIALILRPQAEAKQLAYRNVVAVDVPERLHGDVRHLRQILLNLAGNAVKFTAHGSVTVNVVRRDDGRSGPVLLLFSVSDTGSGIPASLRRRLFHAFERGDDNDARRHGGSGLGASIAKGLTVAMGGRIGYERTPPRGSRFWVELPFERVPEVETVCPESAAAKPPSPGDTLETSKAVPDPFQQHRLHTRQLRVLVVDDHAANRMMLQRLLQKAGHGVACVESGAMALEALSGTSYDVAIADLHMPDVDGVELIRRIRRGGGGNQALPVLIFSADVTPQSIQRSERAGAHAFLAKPIAVATLLEALAGIARRDAVPGSLLETPQGTGEAAPLAFDSRVLDELAELGMGAAFERDFIRQCLNDADGCLGGMMHAGENRQWERMREHAHAVKGIAGNLGLGKLTASCVALMEPPDWQLHLEWRHRLAMLNATLSEGALILSQRLANAAKEVVSPPGEDEDIPPDAGNPA